MRYVTEATKLSRNESNTRAILGGHHMSAQPAENLRVLDELRAWAPPGIRVLVILVVAIGVVTWYFEWRSMLFTALALFTTCAAMAARRARERGIENAERERRHERELAEAYSNAFRDHAHN
jgi:hypothetical protein